MASKTIDFSDFNIHISGPNMLFSGSITVTRDSEATADVAVSLTGNLSFGYPYDSTYGYANYSPVSALKIKVGDKSEGLSVDSNSLYGYEVKSVSASIQNVNWTSGNLVIYSDCHHDNDTCAASGTKTINNEMCTISIDDLPYNSYTAPKLTINSHKDLGVYNKTNDYNINYTVTLGTNSLDWLRLYIYDENNSYLTYKSIDKTATGSNKSFTYTLNGNSRITSGSHYKIKLRLSDNAHEYETGFYDIHTCHEPTVSNLKLYDGNNEITVFSPKDTDVKFKWTQDDGSRWTSQGEHEKTNELYTYTDSTKHSLTPGSNESSLTMTTGNIDKLFPTSERNAASVSKIVTIARNQDQIPKTVTASTSSAITLQLQPNKAMSEDEFYIQDSDGNNIKSTVQNNIVDMDKYEDIILKWTYNYNEIGAGIISGYEIDITTSSTYDWNQPYKPIDVPTTSYNNVSKTISIEDDLYKNKMNYVAIYPYYEDSKGKRWYSSNPLKQVLFYPYTNLKKPIISYPINNTTWHNEKFRVLFQLPDEYDTPDSLFRYKDIELWIDYTVEGVTTTELTYYWSEDSDIYNTDSLTYQNKIVINPSLKQNLPIADKYEIWVRASKTVNGKEVWSPWSDKVTLNRKNLVPLEAGGEDYLTIYSELNEILDESDTYTSPGDTNINIYTELNTILNETDPYTGGGEGTITVGGIIKAEHFNTIRDYSTQLHEVYPITSLNDDNIPAIIENVIYHENYIGIYNTILKIQREVNNYATFDTGRDDVKFNQTINLLSGTEVPIRGEIITAERDLRPGSGRDYLLILYDCLNLLK